MTKTFARLLWLVPGFLLAWSVSAKVQPVDPAQLVSNSQLEKTALIITKVVERYHYKKAPLDDHLSNQILERYLEVLDSNRSFFLQSDIDRFSAYRNRLDDLLGRGNVDPAFEIFRIYRQRVDQRVELALKLLDQPFDFSVDEDYLFDRSKEAPWAGSMAELDEIWRKRVKNDFLSLRLADKPSEDAHDTLRKRYQGLQTRIGQFKADDVFQSFINAYTLTLEPHTSYMSPSSAENFDISMRLSLEGIGAVLRGEGEFTLVQKTISGGPAQLSSQIQAGDKIIGVAQGLDGPVEDVVGWRLQDVVDKIRGPKGSVVRLEIIPKNPSSGGISKVVTLVRNDIKLEEQAAKKSVVTGLPGMANVKIGVIEIPAFYRDFRGESRGDTQFRSTTRDVRQLLKELQAEGVEGILIDLRDNGGGSLSEATELTGLFIDKGPVVQVKDSFGKVDVEEDPDPELAYPGPLSVLVDRNSASASEIFAGAIQDYRRGILIGEPTFGKGTVQTLIDLNRFVTGNEADLGRLRLTMAQFFRINGASTQHQGVVPDVLFPTAQDASKYGERSLDNALPWAHISPARYSAKGVTSYAQLREKSQVRIAGDLGFTLLSDQERLLKELDQVKIVSLNETKRRQETKQREAQLNDQKNRYLLSQGITPSKDETELDSEVEEQEARALAKIQLLEAVRILVDAILEEHQNRPQAAMRN